VFDEDDEGPRSDQKLMRTVGVWEASASGDEGELERGGGRCLQVTEKESDGREN
jgi:hypothetical protein